ncbi:MAG TPA: hypothetical protein VH209_07450 [Steroidobacteraceae bacterium]|jgi:hypothetical protein|nr:hypothetical protein [Steroidobacteraceae bacterium]
MSSAFYPPARPLSVGEVLDLVFQIFKATLVRGLPYGICAVVAQQLPNVYALASGVSVRQALSAGQPIRIALFAVGVLLALVAWSALLLQQRAIIEQRPTSIKSELGEALRRLPSFFVATLLFLVVVGSGAAVIMVVPPQYRTGMRIPLEILGVYLAVFLSCTWPAVLFAGQGPLGALRQSARLVWGNWWRIAVVYVVGAAVVIVVSVLLGALIAAIVSSLGAGIPVMTSVFAEVANVLGAVTAPFAGALLLAVFADLRVRKQGTDLKQRIVDLAVE